MIGNKKAVCNHEWVYECLCIIYHSCTLKSCSKLRAALGTILLHENLSLFSKTFFEKKSQELLRAAALKWVPSVCSV